MTFEETGQDGPVKPNCWDQREALPGEPRCVICGRYGEYICDETDDDICSIECKQILLRKISNSTKPIIKPSVKVPALDECFYVRDSDESNFQTAANNQPPSLKINLDIQIKGGSIPEPLLSFSSADLPKKLHENLEATGYEIPTPVQMQTIPAALVGQSLLVSAHTGSGKTAAFLIPIISRATKFRLDHPLLPKNPLALVLAPTREICIQVEEQAKAFGKGLPFKTALVVGGDALSGQVHRVQQGVELIIGTPGRLIDLLSKHDIELNEVSILVLDEVDCMFQKGFRDKVIQIFQALTRPQILMFSATVMPEIEKIAASLSKDMIKIFVGSPSKPNEFVKQVVIWVETKKKKQKLFEILNSNQHFKPPAMVFVGSRLGADLLADAITVSTGLRALSIHGEKTMGDRRDIMREFLTGQVPLIVTTGVLGRGIDLLRVKQVIIFDMPNSIREYIHQIGRASRFGQEGMAIVFVNDEDKRLLKELVDILKSSRAPIPRELINSCYSIDSHPVPKNVHRKRRRR